MIKKKDDFWGFDVIKEEDDVVFALPVHFLKSISCYKYKYLLK
jgi:hypothetical protein